jgi:hypothetical protein
MAENIMKYSKVDYAGLSNEDMYKESVEVSKMSASDKIKHVNKLYCK